MEMMMMMNVHDDHDEDCCCRRGLAVRWGRSESACPKVHIISDNFVYLAAAAAQKNNVFNINI